MARRQKFEGGTRNRIIEVGAKMFLENGYDGAGIRAIMLEVGADVGVFYYYFPSKDELFNAVLDYLLNPYKPHLEELVDEAEENPLEGLFSLYKYLREASVEFHSKYGENLHRSVKWSIREHALEIIEPYTEEIISMIVERGANPVMDIHTSAVYLAHALGSCLLSDDVAWVNVARPQLIESVKVLMGLKN